MQLQDREKDSYVRCQAVKAIGSVAACGDDVARDACELALSDESMFVRDAASLAVIKLTRTEVMVKQMQVPPLADQSPKVRH